MDDTQQPRSLTGKKPQCKVCRGAWKQHPWGSDMKFEAAYSEIRLAAICNSSDQSVQCYCTEVCFVFQSLPPDHGWPPRHEKDNVMIEITSWSTGRRDYRILKGESTKKEGKGTVNYFNSSSYSQPEDPYVVELCQNLQSSYQTDFGSHVIREVTSNSGNEEAAHLIKGWLDLCQSTHLCCKPITLGKAFSPKRLLDVSRDAADRVLLVSAEDVSSEYVALTYCWGRGQPGLCTNLNNVHRHTSQGITLSSMPQTVQDAVRITRMLDVRYLWVDRFCIVQGSEQEWAEESNRMVDIYQNAVLTISADASDGALGGIFEDHKFAAQAYKEVPVKQNIGDIQGPKVWMRECAKGHGIGLHDSPDSQPIDRRAWTMQEKFVSKRVLHYTKHELEWRCLEGRRCECQRFVSSKPSVGVASLRSLRETHDVALIRKEWKNVVKEFTSRALTVPSDKLLALSGIASKFQEAIESATGTQVKYYAGLWSDDIASQLVWTRPSSEEILEWTKENFCETSHRLGRFETIQDFAASWSETRTSPDAYVAPSWSWASNYGPARYFGAGFGESLYPFPFQSKVKIISEATYTRVAPNHGAFGHLSGGQLTLEAYTITDLVMLHISAGPEGGGPSHLFMNLFLMGNRSGTAFQFSPDHPDDVFTHKCPTEGLVCMLVGFVDVDIKHSVGVGLSYWTAEESLILEKEPPRIKSTRKPSNRHGNDTKRSMAKWALKSKTRSFIKRLVGPAAASRQAVQTADSEHDNDEEAFYLDQDRDERTHPPSNPLSREFPYAPSTTNFRQTFFLLLAPTEGSISSQPTYKRVACIQPNLTAPKERVIMRKMFNDAKKMTLTIV